MRGLTNKLGLSLESGSGVLTGDGGFQPQCSFLFDGGVDIITWGDVLDAHFSTGVFAIGIVYKRTATGTLQNIIGKWDNVGNNRSILVRFTAADKLQAFISANGSTAVNVLTSGTFTDTSNWHSVVFVMDTTEAVNADRVKIYHDGAPAALDAPSGTWAAPFDATSNLVFGNRIEGGGDTLMGYLNQHFVLSDAPTATEISDFHNGGQPLWALDHFDNVVLQADQDNAVFNATTLEWEIPDLSPSGLADGNTKSNSITSGDRDCNENPY